ncbi:TetR/AcrR family transcriptional regulator [soil metagenome]
MTQVTTYSPGVETPPIGDAAPPRHIGRRRQFDDATAVRAARDVFWERGYASTSLADLQAATGLSRSSIYQAYGSKQGLFDRAVGNYCNEIMWPIVEPMEAEGAGRNEVVAYFLELARYLRGPRAEASRGCLMANTAAELRVLDSATAHAVRRFQERVHAAFVHALGATDSLESSAAQAEILTAAQAGLMMTARLDPIPAAKMAETVAAGL